MPDSFAKIAELESQIVANKKLQSEATEGLDKDLKDLKEKIEELLLILEALKTLGKFATLIEKVGVFLFKIGTAIGFFYAVYKFGISEIAEKVKGVVK